MKVKTKIVTHVRRHIMDQDFISLAKLAKHWGDSPKKARRKLEEYRGQPGFKDSGSPEDFKKHKRRYAILSAHPTLIAKIEADMRKHLQEPRGSKRRRRIEVHTNC